MSDPVTVTTSVPSSGSGVNPTTTRLGNPSCLAISAAATAYCSWSPSIGRG